MSLVTKDMLLGTVVAEHPEAAAVMLEYGLHCVGCFANAYDTVEVGAKVHGMSDAEVDEMVQRVNEAIENGGNASTQEMEEESDPSVFFETSKSKAQMSNQIQKSNVKV